MTIEDKAKTTGEWAETHKPVVVAVDGSERNRSAVLWAANEAADHGASVVLVTALQELVVTRPHGRGRSREQETLDMLADVRAEVRHVVDEQVVETEAVVGAPVEALLREAADARLVVVGKRGLGGFARVLVGSTSIALAGRSPVPVAIVPDGWEPGGHAGEPIVLGVDPARPDHRPMHLAFRRARRLGVPLMAVHGWETPAAFAWKSEVVAGALAEHEQEVGRMFDELLATWTDRFPEVEVRPVRVHQHPATAILEAAEEAQLVVLGRHDTGIFGGFPVGSVARAVLHYAETPVLTVPSGSGE
ncbi:MAG TPA: universal stress protein [Nocardioidaceae bacterium]